MASSDGAFCENRGRHSERLKRTRSIKGFVASLIESLLPQLWLRIRILRRDKHFEAEYWFVPYLCDPKRVAIDIGGNEGHFSYYMSKFSSQVHSFEPNPICIGSLARIKTKNMTIHPVALSISDGAAEMRFDPNNTGIGTVEKFNKLDNNEGIGDIVNIEVAMRRLDSYDLDDVAFIKIDVEGHEPSVIIGGIETIEKFRPYILMECEVRHNPSAYHEVVNCLHPLGYSVYYVDGQKLSRLSNGGIEKLQAFPVNSDHYVNNFLFIPDEKLEVLSILTDVVSKLR